MLNPKPVGIKNILAIRTDRFGEFILTLPAIHALKDNFPGSHLTVMSSPYSAQLIQGSPVVDSIIEYKEDNFKGFISTLRLVFELKKQKFDLVVIFNPKRKLNIVTLLAGIRNRVGYNRKWGFLLTKRLEDKKYLGAKHEVEYNLDLVKTIGVEPKAIVFPVIFDKNDEQHMEEILNRSGINSLSPLVIVHPWTSDSSKQWPVASFIKLARKLVYELNQRVILIGGAEEATRSRDFIKETGNEIINLAGKISLRQLAALFKKANILISNDSGPVHLAASLKIPVVAIFRSGIAGKSPRRWGPWGEGHAVIEKDNIAQISVDEVFNKIKETLKR